MSESVALGANVGTAWVALRFSARGARAQIASQLKAETAGIGVAEGEAAGSNFSKSFGKRMSGLGASVKSALGPTLKYTTLALAATGVEAAHLGVTFQSAMEKVHTQAGAAQSEVTKMSKAILDLAASGQSQHGPQQLAEGLYHLESLGLRGAKAMDALKTAEHLASVSGADLEETTSAIGGAWRTGIKGAQSFTKSAATLNAVVGAGNMRMSDLLGALGTGILPAAKTFGLSLNQVGAALALFTDEGVPATDAATRLRMTFSLLGAPSQLAIKQLKSIGIGANELGNTLRTPNTGLIDAIQLLKDHLDSSGLSATKQAALLSRAFGGGRSSAALLSMLNNLDVLKKKQDQVNSSTGKYGPAVLAQRKTASAQWHILAAEVQGILTKLGVAMLPQLTKLASFLNKTVVPGVLNLRHVFANVIPVDQIKRDWAGLMRFFGVHSTVRPAVAPSAAAVNAATGASYPGLHGLPSAAQANAATIAKPVANGVGNAFKNINWSDLLGKAISAGVKNAGKIGAAILTLIGKINWADLGKKAAFAFVPFAIGLINNLVNALISEAIHHPLDLLVFITSLIPIGRAAGIILKVFGEIKFLGPLLKLFLGPVEKVGGFVETALGKMLKKVFGPIASKIGAFFKGSASWLVKKGGDILLGLLSGIEKFFPKIASWFLKIGSKFVGWFVKADKWLLVAGGSIILGMLHGILAKMAGIGDWIWGNVVSPVINWVKKHFGIKSPSTVMHGIGFNLIAGLLKGIVSADPIGPIKKIFGGIPSALAHFVEKGLIHVKSLPQRALSILSSFSGFSGLLQSGSSFLSGLVGKLFGSGNGGAGVQQWAGLVSKVLSMLGLPASYLGPWLSQMNTESGGRVNAINLTDINAQRGDPSRGLLQVIGSTFAAYAGPFRRLGIYNPLANIYAAINYAKHRYGAAGMLGVIGHGHGYDSGGIARGLGFLPKYTPKPERVLSPTQTMSFERLVDAISGKSGGSRPGRMRVEFDPRTMEMWIRDLAVDEARGEYAFNARKR